MKPAMPLVLLGLLSACSDSEPPPGPSAETLVEFVRALHARVDEVAARPEFPDEEVTFQHLLVGVGAEYGRSPAEAEALAAELFARASGGEDFDLLVKNYTNELHPGIYTLTRGADDRPRAIARAGFVPGLGDVTWRLGVGELGVSPYDGSGVPGQSSRSPLGFHLIKRLK